MNGGKGGGLTRGGGELPSLVDDDFDAPPPPRVMPDILNPTSKDDDILHDIGDPSQTRVNYRVCFAAQPTLTRQSAVAINRYAPINGYLPEEATRGDRVGSNLGYGYGGHSNTNGNITGRVSVLSSKHSNRSSLMSGISLQSSKPVSSKYAKSAYFSSNKYRILQDGRLPNQASDSNLSGIGPLSKYVAGSAIK